MFHHVEVTMVVLISGMIFMFIVIGY